jgi:hypothetical protein
MNRILRHIIIPTALMVAFFAVVATPVEAIGCRNRGLLAVSIAFISVLAGLGTAIIGVFIKGRKNPDAQWWILSTLILVIPPVALIILA